MSRLEEIEHTRFLAERLSNELGTHYEAIDENEENSDVDTYIVDEKGFVTSIQNVTSEGSVLQNMSLNTRAFYQGEKFVAQEVNHSKWVNDIINKKIKKQYSNSNQLILVIHASMPKMPAYYTLRQIHNIPNSDFAGVYYVSTPNSSPNTGYVIALKKFWDTKDIF